MASQIKEFFNFIADARAEAWHITWPSKDIVVRSVIIIAIFAALLALYFFITDSVLNRLVGVVFR
ncbi:MAG: preprotein translocase subunit SecE [Rickettsiales bacterium]|jgi:preprotein translocase SecE subunit|nr:preprotein translocase subunit SecE [Rickettsiales bacterium]